MHTKIYNSSLTCCPNPILNTSSQHALYIRRLFLSHCVVVRSFFSLARSFHISSSHSLRTVKMRISPRSALDAVGAVGGLLGSSILDLPNDDCLYNGDFMLPIDSQSILGFTGGGYFCAGQWSGSGLIIKGMQAWGDGHRLTGIQFTYSDNTQSDVFGKTYGDPQGISWDPTAESVKSFNIMGPYHEDGVGRIMLTTTGGQSYSFGGDTGDYQGKSVNVGSGVILGAVGACGDWLDNLGLVFLSDSVQRITITDVEFDEDVAAMNAKQRRVYVHLDMCIPYP